MLKKILRNFFKNIIYPTKQRNWYQSKGYIGIDEAAQFEHFISAQKDRNAIFYNEFKDLELKRQFITSDHNHLDSVLISMPREAAKDKPGFGLCFIFFQGRAEYYESRFRDMARQCKATGASAFGFNPKGFNSSNGSTERIKDIVDDGIAVVNYLLSQGKSLNQIILQGNSLGAAVQEMVSKHFKATKGTALRQINSNSFKNLGAVFAHQYHIPFLEKLISKIMRYGEWEIEVDDDFYTTGPHRCYFRREGDRTILPQAEYHSMINHERDYENCPDHFKDTNRWLNNHTQLIYKNIILFPELNQAVEFKGETAQRSNLREHRRDLQNSSGSFNSENGITDEDPHDLSLHHFIAKPLSTIEPEYTIYDLINRFIGN